MLLKENTVYKKNSIFNSLKKDKILLLFLVPMIAHLFIFCYLPMYGILIAFQDYKMGKAILAFNGSIDWVGFKHFIDFFQSVYFMRVIRNAFLLGILWLAFGFWVPVIFALLLNEVKNILYKKVVQTFSYLPYFVSTVIIVGISINMLSSVDGVVNRIIEYFGGTAIQFFNEQQYFRPLYIIIGIWQTFGWSSVLYLANIASIDQGQYEAAKIDGANRWQQAIHITLPGITPTIIILLIFAMGSLLSSDTEKILLLYNPAIYDTADVIGTYTYRTGILNGRFSYAGAVGLFATVINFIMLWISNRISNKISGQGLW